VEGTKELYERKMKKREEMRIVLLREISGFE
jgi:hypothetical protein